MAAHATAGGPCSCTARSALSNASRVVASPARLAIAPFKQRKGAAVCSGRAAAVCSASSSDSIPAVAPVSRRGLLAAASLAALASDLALFAPQAAVAAGGRLPTKEEKAAIDAALAKVAPRPKAPVLLRLIFHDAGTYDEGSKSGGANGSILYELKRPENKGLGRGTRIVESLLEELQGTAAEGISFTDGICLAAAHAVTVCGGPEIAMPIGRVDAAEADPEGRLPAETLDAAALRGVFARVGMSTQEFVALSGAHTLGAKGFGPPLDFTNEYYSALQKKPWENTKDEMAAMIGLASDHVLPDDPPSRAWIDKYAADQALFFRDFAAALVKLGSQGATWA